MGADGAPRYAEIVYASTERGAGGWQITSRTGELTAAEEAELKSFVVTTFDAHGGPLPMYVDASQIHDMPVRFGAAPSAGGGVVLWQASQAGTDSTGRPGNVFSQVVLDRVGDGQPPAIAFWRSPSFALPYGPVEVREAAERPPFEPKASAVTTAAAVIGSILDYATYLRLAVLLDAVNAARSSGLPVVLRGSDQDEAARLVAAMCALTIPAWSRNLRFSLYERSKAITMQTARRWDLAVIPEQDEPVETGVVSAVIGLQEEPQPGDGSQPHLTEYGDQVQVTEWSELLQHLTLLSEDQVEAVLRTLSGWTDASTGAPGWWLALAMASTPAIEDGDDDQPGPREAALQVLRTTPAPLLADDRVGVLEEALSPVPALRELGHLLNAMTDDDGRYVLLAERFVEDAVRDLRALPIELPELRRGHTSQTIGNPAMIDAAIADLVAAGDVDVRMLNGLISVLEVSGWLRRDDVQSAPISNGVVSLLVDLLQRADIAPVSRALGRLPEGMQLAVLIVFATTGSRAAQQRFIDSAPLGLVQKLDLLDVGYLRGRARAVSSPIGRRAVIRALSEVDDLPLADEFARALDPAEQLRRSGRGEVLRQSSWTAQNLETAALIRPDLLAETDLAHMVLTVSDEQWGALQRTVGSGAGPALGFAVAVRAAAAKFVRTGALSEATLADIGLPLQMRQVRKHADEAGLRLAPSVTSFVAAAELVIALRRRKPQGLRPETFLLLQLDTGGLRASPVDLIEVLTNELEANRGSLVDAVVVGAAWLDRGERSGGPDGGTVLGLAVHNALFRPGQAAVQIQNEALDRYDFVFPPGPLSRLPGRKKPVDAFWKWAQRDVLSERVTV